MFLGREGIRKPGQAIAKARDTTVCSSQASRCEENWCWLSSWWYKWFAFQECERVTDPSVELGAKQGPELSRQPCSRSWGTGCEQDGAFPPRPRGRQWTWKGRTGSSVCRVSLQQPWRDSSVHGARAARCFLAAVNLVIVCTGPLLLFTIVLLFRLCSFQHLHLIRLHSN